MPLAPPVITATLPIEPSSRRGLRRGRTASAWLSPGRRRLRLELRRRSPTRGSRRPRPSSASSASPPASTPGWSPGCSVGHGQAFRGERRTKSSAISSKVAQRTPSWPLMCSISRSSISSTWGRPETSGWMVMVKTRVVHLAVDPVELVAPHLLDVARVDEAVAVRAGLDEHHRRQVVEVPVRRDLDQVGLLAAHQRLHPLVGRLRRSRSWSSSRRPARSRARSRGASASGRT